MTDRPFRAIVRFLFGCRFHLLTCFVFRENDRNLQWYFNRQVFDCFRPYFAIVFFSLWYVLILPRSVRFQHLAVELMGCYWFVYMIFHIRPMVTDPWNSWVATASSTWSSTSNLRWLTCWSDSQCCSCLHNSSVAWARFYWWHCWEFPFLCYFIVWIGTFGWKLAPAMPISSSFNAWHTMSFVLLSSSTLFCNRETTNGTAIDVSPNGETEKTIKITIMVWDNDWYF